MKKVKEAEKEVYQRDDNYYFSSNYESHFIKGFNFANEWISVEDELPEVDKEDCWNSTHHWSKKVITKNDELNFPNYEIKAYNPELHEWQTSNKVTHWRPIERS